MCQAIDHVALLTIVCADDVLLPVLVSEVKLEIVDVLMIGTHVASPVPARVVITI